MTHAPDALVLVADIGGTYTRAALAEGVRILPGSVRRYRNAEHAGLEAVLTRYLADEGGPDPRAACVAAAGPVHEGVAQMTNLDWRIDRETVARATRCGTVAVLNDLQAQGHALEHLGPDRLTTLVRGAPAGPRAARMVAGIGTGMNAAPVFATPTGTLVPPSEAGHAALPVETEADFRLATYLRACRGFADIEEALSGRGIEHIYHWLSTGDGRDDRMTAGEIMVALEDPAASQAREAVAVFTRIAGHVVGNLALTLLPFGGIYLSGGVARAMARHAGEFGFARAVAGTGRFARFLENFPIHVIEDDYAALTGSASHLAEISQDSPA